MSKPNQLKQEVVLKYFEEKKTITEIADEYNIAPSTVFVWCKKYEIDKEIFIRPQSPKISYRKDYYTQEEVDILYNEIMKKDIALAQSKKGYAVKGVGTNKEYVILEDLTTK